MPLFDGPAPRLYYLPPGADFAADLARGLRARLAGAPPETLARVTLALNTRRALRAHESNPHGQRLKARDDAAAVLVRL